MIFNNWCCFSHAQSAVLNIFSFRQFILQRQFWSTKNESCLAELWIQMLRFYCVEFDMGTNVICIRQKKPLPRSEKKWASKRIALEGGCT
jgi:hypothetical protein